MKKSESKTSVNFEIPTYWQWRCLSTYETIADSHCDEESGISSERWLKFHGRKDKRWLRNSHTSLPTINSCCVVEWVGVIREATAHSQLCVKVEEEA